MLWKTSVERKGQRDDYIKPLITQNTKVKLANSHSAMHEFMHHLTEYASNSSSPFFMVIVLGLVFALDPCLLMTNIAAIGYLGREIDKKHTALTRGLYYTLGRTITYGILGVVLITLLRLGKSVEPIEHFIDHYGTYVISPVLLIMGLLLIFADKISWLRISSVQNIRQERFKGNIGAFLLGAVLTFAFCPTNAIIFFGMMVPVCSVSAFGYLLPFIFAATTAIPIIITAYLLAFSLNSIGRYYDKIKTIGNVLRIIVGILFIIIAILMLLSIFPLHHHY